MGGRIYGLIGIALLLGLEYCGGEKTATPVTVPTEGTVETVPVLNVASDPQIGRAFSVIHRTGILTRRHATFKDFAKSGAAAGNSAFDPSAFYDTYMLKIREQGHWIRVHFNSAEKAITEDGRVKEKMSGLPVNAMDVELELPGGKTFLLSDSDGNGVLDFAAPKNGQAVNPANPDRQLLEQMQKKYQWILSVIKKYYK